jgi:hypothetical protein
LALSQFSLERMERTELTDLHDMPAYLPRGGTY